MPKVKKEVKKIPVNLKFYRSKEKPEKLVSYVTKKNSSWIGVRVEAEVAKKVVVIGCQIKNIIEGALYNATLIPMREKEGFVAVKIVPVQFEAKMETLYHKSGDFYIKISFGNKCMVYDPKNKNPLSSDINQFKNRLEKRIDIRNLPSLIEDFDRAVNIQAIYTRSND